MDRAGESGHTEFDVLDEDLRPALEGQTNGMQILTTPSPMPTSGTTTHQTYCEHRRTSVSLPLLYRRSEGVKQIMWWQRGPTWMLIGWVSEQLRWQQRTYPMPTVDRHEPLRSDMGATEQIYTKYLLRGQTYIIEKRTEITGTWWHTVRTRWLNVRWEADRLWRS